MQLSQLCVSSDICPDLMIRFGFLTSQIADDLLNNKGMRNPSGSALVVSASDLLVLVFFASSVVLYILLHQNKLRCNARAQPTPWNTKRSFAHANI